MDPRQRFLRAQRGNAGGNGQGKRRMPGGPIPGSPTPGPPSWAPAIGFRRNFPDGNPQAGSPSSSNIGGGGFNPFAAGNRMGAMPNVGPIRDRTGYETRDRNAQTMRDAMLRRLQAQQGGRHMNPDALRG